MNLHLPQLNDWNDDFRHAPAGVPVLLFHKDWIDEDFCPEGVIEGYFDYANWVGAVWNSSSDEWDATVVTPSHWRYMPQGPK